MINFRYHIVSLIAVFLALGIGVIVGTAVIDSAVVDRLESQQRGLESRIEDVRSENGQLRDELGQVRDTADRLAEEGSQRLLDGALTDVPVLTVAFRQAETDGFDDLASLLTSADARSLGTIWLTDRFDLDDESERADLAEALGASPTMGVDAARRNALSSLADALRPGQVTVSPTLVALREAGFVDFDPPEGGNDDQLPLVGSGTRVVVTLTAPAAAAVASEVMQPLLAELVGNQSAPAVTPVLGVASSPAEDEQEAPLVVAVRDDDELGDRLSTVDNIDEFAGRLAAVLALVDLGGGRTGHYGRGDGAQRLLPAPVE